MPSSSVEVSPITLARPIGSIPTIHNTTMQTHCFPMAALNSAARAASLFVPPSANSTRLFGDDNHAESELESWWANNKSERPLPSERELWVLAQRSGLSESRVFAWFTLRKLLTWRNLAFALCVPGKEELQFAAMVFTSIAQGLVREIKTGECSDDESSSN